MESGSDQILLIGSSVRTRVWTGVCVVGIQFLDDCAKRELDMMLSVSVWDHMIWGLDQSYLLLAGPIIGSATPARCLTDQLDKMILWLTVTGESIGELSCP